MSFIETVKQMKFEGVDCGDYSEEPMIVFQINDPNAFWASSAHYTLTEFKALIAKCERLGVDCQHLKDCLPEFENDFNIFVNMREPIAIRAAM